MGNTVEGEVLYCVMYCVLCAAYCTDDRHVSQVVSCGTHLKRRSPITAEGPPAAQERPPAYGLGGEAEGLRLQQQ